MPDEVHLVRRRARLGQCRARGRKLLCPVVPEQIRTGLDDGAHHVGGLGLDGQEQADLTRVTTGRAGGVGHTLPCRREIRSQLPGVDVLAYHAAERTGARQWQTRLMTRLHITGDEDADTLLSEDPLALLIGMLLDQQVAMETAFAGPHKLAERLGGLDAHRLATINPDELAEVCRTPPAVHRY